MRRENRETIEPQNWVPWIGLGLVIPALLIMLVFIFAAFPGGRNVGSGEALRSGGSSSASVLAGLVCIVAAVGGLMLAVVGIVRGFRRPAPHTGRSVGIAGFSLEIATLVVGIAAIVLGVAALI
jgi:hypothetical protein